MQYKTILLNLALALIVLTSWTVTAQGPGGRGGPGHRPPKPAIDEALDADGDGIINAEEIANATSLLLELDADYDGGLSLPEYMGFPTGEGAPQAPPTGGDGSGGKPPAPPTVSTIDTNGDQVIDGSELAGASTTLNELDTNGDGSLQADEYQPSHPGGDREGGRPTR